MKGEPEMMKKIHRWISLSIACIMILAMSIPVHAAGTISADKARSIAYADAGVSASSVSRLETELDRDDGVVVYEIGFYVGSTEYDYVINAANGRILEREIEGPRGAAPQPAAPTQAAPIGIEKAKSIALADAGLSAASVVFTKAAQDREDGRIVYDVEFFINNDLEYEYEIDGTSGAIREKSVESLTRDSVVVRPATNQKAVSMYRLYNPNSGEHFYTGSVAERVHLVRIGWRNEGIGWYAPLASSTPVYRLYNPNAGDHHYTASKTERDYLISVGWNDEGIGWYSDDAKAVSLYRQYNPNAKTGSHNYTVSKGENDQLVGLGWHAEGIGWYSLA